MSTGRRNKVEALVTAELVNVAAGLLGAKRAMQAAVDALTAGAPGLPDSDLSIYLPRSMPFTRNLGTDLLVLSERQIDVLSTLESNLASTRGLMQDISGGRRTFGLLAATELNNSVAQDLRVLAEAFEVIAPSRELQIEEQAPDLASQLLRRVAASRAKPMDQR